MALHLVQTICITILILRKCETSVGDFDREWGKGGGRAGGKQLRTKRLRKGHWKVENSTKKTLGGKKKQS